MAYKVYTKKLTAYERKRREQRHERNSQRRIGLAVSGLLSHVEAGIRAAAEEDPSYGHLLGADAAETLGLFSDHLNDLVEQDKRDHTQEAAVFLDAINFWPSAGADMAGLLRQTLTQTNCDRTEHPAV